MLCYRDRTYCAAACRNTECDRNRTHVPADTQGLPVSWADLSEGCPGFVPAYRADSYEDATACVALRGEAAAKERE